MTYRMVDPAWDPASSQSMETIPFLPWTLNPATSGSYMSKGPGIYQAPRLWALVDPARAERLRSLLDLPLLDVSDEWGPKLLRRERIAEIVALNRDLGSALESITLDGESEVYEVRPEYLERVLRELPTLVDRTEVDNRVVYSLGRLVYGIHQILYFFNRALAQGSHIVVD